MQELTKLDVNRLKSYKVDFEQSLLHPHYPASSGRQHGHIPFQETTHRQPTTSSLKDHPIHPHFNPHQHPVTLVQSISVPSPGHQRRSSCILSLREIKDLQEPNRQGSRRSLQVKNRKIFVSIAKSNCKQRQAVELGGGDDSRRKITLTKYISFKSNQKPQRPC